MNGAKAILRTLVGSGVDVCFANPGTSEMHLVAALDAVPEMRAVLGTFEGVVTGAADGYGRMAGRPAATLLHLGPGLGNGLANLHNARRAGTPVCNLVGDHATYHKQYDAPLESDIDAVAGSVSGWVRRVTSAGEAGRVTAEAVAASRQGGGCVATLVVPADVSWSGPAGPAPARTVPQSQQVAGEVDGAVVDDAARAVRSAGRTAVLFGGAANRAAGLRALSRIANATGVTVYGEYFPARLERGAGLPNFERLGYVPEHVQQQLTGVEHIVLAGVPSPVAFFAYPDTPSSLVPDGAVVHRLAGGGQDVTAALEALADAVAPGEPETVTELAEPGVPDGELTVQSMAPVVGAVLPEGAVVVDESNTSGLMLPGATAGSPRHDWLALTGGAIGSGLPLAAGAAIAAPDRPVLCLQADGSALYTIQALATHAREGLDITTLLVNNRSYAILRMELQRLAGDESGPRSAELLDLAGPELDFVAIARGMGVPASRASTADELARQLRGALAEPGPHLVEALVPPLA